MRDLLKVVLSLVLAMASGQALADLPIVLVQAYLGQEDRLASRADQLEEFVHYVKGEITKVVGK
ncbi:Streptomycin adenyltransferase [Shigella flexneri 2a]|nr:Streptomycin adenyltransferase [Shigella flexneri 2a]